MPYPIHHLPIRSVRVNPENPRFIKDEDFARLVMSIKQTPTLLEARPLLVSDRTGELIILGGNMRYRAALELQYPTIPVIILSGLTEEQEREVIIKDNGAFGSWDFDILANEWSDLPLADWGVPLPADWLEEEGEEGDSEGEGTEDGTFELILAFQTSAARQAAYQELTDRGYQVRLTEE